MGNRRALASLTGFCRLATKSRNPTRKKPDSPRNRPISEHTLVQPRTSSSDIEWGTPFPPPHSNFFIKKLAKKTPKILNVYTDPHARCRPGPAKSGPLRGADLRFVYGLYIFYMRFGRPNYRLPARRGFRVSTGKHSCEGSDGVRRP